jgi:hypothetical protein
LGGRSLKLVLIVEEVTRGESGIIAYTQGNGQARLFLAFVVDFPF